MSPVLVSCPECQAHLKIRDRSLLGRKVKCPKCARAILLDLPSEDASPTNATSPVNSSAETRVASPENESTTSWPDSSEGASVTERLKAQQRQRTRRRLMTAAGSAALLLLAGLVGLSAVWLGPKPPAVSPQVALDESTSDRAADQVENAPKETTPAAPPQPIELQYIPAGTRIVIQLHPSELWRSGGRADEFRLCLGPIGEFLGERIRELAKREPSDVSEALFCLIPGERGTAPGLAAVFRLREEVPRSRLLDELGGQRMEEGETAYYLRDDRAYLIADQDTIAVCPADMAGEMVAAIRDRQATSEGITALLPQTDRARALTVIFEPTATRIDAEFLLPKSAIPLLNQFLDWLGPEVETAAWSLDWQLDEVQSELIVRNQGGLQARTVERQMQKRLDQLAENVLNAIKKLAPAEAGRRQLIGRVPAMVRAATLATHTSSGPRFVRLTALLPERAAPNLALGTLLAWDESTRGVPGKSRSPDSPEMVSPDRTPLSERLQRKITVEFHREPLQGAFTFIGEEIKTTIEIDGDALKLAAYTKNMPQTFSLENSPASQVIQTIFQQPMQEKLCLVIDEARNRLLITTYASAEQQGLAPYSFPQ